MDNEQTSQPKSPDKNAFWWEVLGLAVVSVVGAAVIGLLWTMLTSMQANLKAEQQKDAQARGVTPIAVIVTELKDETVTDIIHLPGRITPGTTIAVPAEVGGQVIKTKNTPVEDGSKVIAGQPLINIDPRDYEIALKQAESNLKLAKENYRRTQTLVKQGVRTPSNLDTDLTALQQAEAAFDTARLALDRCVIRSPIEGHADDILPEIGEFLSPGQKVASLLDIDPVKIEIGLPEKDVESVRERITKNNKIEVKFESISENGEALKVTGKCTYISLQPLEMAFVYNMRIEIANPDGRLRPGMFAEAQVIRGIHPGSVVVPLFAVIAKGDDHFVYVVDESQESGPVAELRKVKLGIMLGERVQISEGLKAGEKLIIMGQRSVDDRGSVKIVKTVDSLAEWRR